MKEIVQKIKKSGKYVGLCLMVVLVVLIIARFYLAVDGSGWDFTICQCPWTCPDHEFPDIIDLNE